MWESIFAIALGLMNYVLGQIKASDATRQAFLNLVASIKNDGLISVEAHDEFQKQQQDLMKKLGGEKA